MAKSVAEYDILISCPGDVNDTLPLIDEVLQQFNDRYTDVLSIRLIPKHWSTSSYNQSGGKPQDLLNKQFVHDCDAAIAIFWARFGTPTNRYGSGAEEEIEDMLAAGKQVFMYFCEKPVAPELMLDEDARSQYKKVKDFQKRYKDEGKGIYDTYSSDEEFRKKLFAHVSQHFLSLKKIEAIAAQRKPMLKLKGIVSGHLCDYYSLEKFFPNGTKRAETWCAEIQTLFSKIASYGIVDKEPERSNTYFATKVVLKADIIDTIRKMACLLGIELASNFFALGSLSEQLNFSASVFSGKILIGTDEEKEKYNCIIDLCENIKSYLGYVRFESAFSQLHCIRLAVSNVGTAYDDDIDISLSFPLGSILLPQQLPELGEYACRCIIEDYSVEVLFGIPATSSYSDYDSSSTLPYTPVSAQSDSLLSGHDYRQEFSDAIDGAFCYEFFEEADSVILNLHIDYLKHNTSVAFPTVLFVEDDLSEIKYTIRSKQNEAEVTSVLSTGDSNEASV